MTFLSRLTILAALSGTAIAQSYTAVTDTLLPALSGQPVNGSITITWPQFTYAASTVAPSPINGYTFPFINGVLSVRLVPTDNSSTTVLYKVVTTVGSQAFVSYWSVPTLPSGRCASSTHCTVAEVSSFTSTPSTGLTWSGLTNAQWGSMTTAQWTTLRN
jgi:hypothetical protein